MSTKIQDQPFDYYIIIDFEANCKKDDEVFLKEIIEFPLVCVNSKTLEIELKFHTFVKPTINKEITNFCSLLTGVVQDDVKDAPTLETAIEMVDKFLNENNLGKKFTFAIACDGPWDMRNFLHDECLLKKIDRPKYYDKWVNIRSKFQDFYKLKRRVGVEKMLAYQKLEFIGNPHSGLDDSINIARILIQMIKDGCRAEINDSL